MHKNLSLIFSLGCCTLGNFLFANSAIAQEITTDGTTDTQVTPEGNGNFTINQGDRAGNNLFHSFDNFSVPTNGSALFNNATDISNIFSRVTGGNISNIDGLIEANGAANLFLVNPAGIMFGSNARLDIGGSFLGTTADSILFEDGTFSATDLDNPPLLTINAPIGLNFRDNPAAIDNQSTASANLDAEQTFDDNLFGLRVPDGKTFALAGGDINADAGGIVAVGGRIELGAVGAEGTLRLTLTDDNISFSFPDDLSRANVSLTNNAGFLVSGSGGGDIAITANNIEILEGSGLFAGIFSGLGSTDAQAGDIEIKAASLFLNNNATINNDVFGEGNAGNITIDIDSLNISQSNITSRIFGKGDAGDININASESIEIDGDILTDDGEAFSPGGILNQVDRSGEGQGGDLTISTSLLNVSNGAKVQANTFGDGNPGNLSVFAKEINVFDTEDSSNQFSTGIFAEVNIDPRNEQFASGSATDLTIETEILSIRGGATVSAETSGIGDGGNISINATELVEIIGTDKNGNPSNINANVGSPNLDTSVDLMSITRNGGNITIDTNQLKVRDGGSITASAFSQGDAGNINIFGKNIELDGGTDGLLTGLSTSFFASVEENATNMGGNIFIETESLSLSNRGEIDADIRSETGEGGNINLQVSNEIVLRDNSSISAQAFNNANGGKLTIDTDFIIAFPDGNNDIVANAQQGEGGVITITAESLLGITERPLNDLTNDINASSQDSTLDGEIVINTSDINPIQGATELPINPVDLDRSVVQACRSNQQTGKTNSFIINGRGGVPASPTAPLTSESVTLNGQPLANSQPNAIATSKGYIIPARGVVKTKDGRIILTANPSSSYERSPNGLRNCNGV